jgi:broad specificity phosphatase PhoE
MHIVPDLQEIGTRPCDTGSSVHQLVTDFPDFREQLTNLPDAWHQKQMEEENQERVWRQAGEKARIWLMERQEEVVVVVTHNGLLRSLLGDALWTRDGICPTGFDNGELRRITMDVSGTNVCVDSTMIEFTSE